MINKATQMKTLISKNILSIEKSYYILSISKISCLQKINALFLEIKEFYTRFVNMFMIFNYYILVRFFFLQQFQMFRTSVQ